MSTNNYYQPPDWRGLCEELSEFVARLTKHYYEPAELLDRARALLAQPEPEAVVVTDEEAEQLHDNLRTPIYDRLSADTPEFFVGYAPVRPGDFARAVLARFGHQPAPPAEGEVAQLVAKLRRLAPQNPLGSADPTILRAATLLSQLSAAAPAVVPVAVSKALIKAECALADVAEGERWCDEGDLLQWAERRCAKALANIRPVMKQHQIRTSEWPPLPAPQGGEVKA